MLMCEISFDGYFAVQSNIENAERPKRVRRHAVYVSYSTSSTSYVNSHSEAAKRYECIRFLSVSIISRRSVFVHIKSAIQTFAYIKQSEIFAPLPPHKSENMKLFYSFAIGYFIDWNKNVGWSCNYRYRTLVINLFDPNLPKDVLANNSAITTVEYLVGAAKFACMQYGWMRMHWTGNQWLLNWEWRQITSVSRLQIWCIPTRDHRLDVRPKNMLNRIICISVLSGTRWLRSH